MKIKYNKGKGFSNVLLLTACINPNGMQNTVLTNVKERLMQYKESLQYYLSQCSCKIVFVENTGFDMGIFFKKEIAEGKLECLTFDGNNYDKSLGKGFGEALIIQYALQHSTIIDNETRIIKITGRVKVRNARKMLNYLEKQNSKTVFADYNRHKSEWDKLASVVVAAPKHFWLNFIENKSEINEMEGYYFEHLLKDTVQKWLIDKGQFMFWGTPIELEGKSGSSGKTYSKKHPYMKWIIKTIFFHVYIKKKMFNKK